MGEGHISMVQYTDLGLDIHRKTVKLCQFGELRACRFIIQTSQRNVYLIIAKFVLGGCWGGGIIFLRYSILTRGLLYVVHKKTVTLPICIVTGL